MVRRQEVAGQLNLIGPRLEAPLRQADQPRRQSSRTDAPPLPRVLRSGPARRGRGGREVSGSAPPSADWGDAGGRQISPVPGEPWCVSALFWDPGRTGSTRPLRCADAAPPLVQAVGSLREACFRGSMARPPHSLSTLRPRGRPGGRKTRFWLLARLYRVGLATHRVPSKGFRVVPLTSLPPFPGLPDARTLSSAAGAARRAV
jgi:hypothetical protein